MRPRQPVGLLRYLAHVALGLSLGVGLAACGATTQLGGAAARTGHDATPPLATSSVASTPTAHATSSPGAPSSGVILTLDRSQYATSDTIMLTIYNGLSTTIYAQTNHSDCELVTLERLVNGVWQVAASCSGALPAPRMEQLAPKGSLEQVLTARKPGPTGVSVGVSWPAGTYRIVLVYVTGSSQPLNQGTAAYSCTFIVA